MIRIDKGNAPPPSLVEAREKTAANLAAWESAKGQLKITSGEKSKKGRTSASGQAKAKQLDESIHILSSIYAATDVKVALVRTHHGKCAFCESRLLHVSHGDVEHFRPKAGYNIFDWNSLSGMSELDHRGYFWLAYEWENLYLSCQICNQTYKKNFFAMMPELAEQQEDLSELPEAELLKLSQQMAQQVFAENIDLNKFDTAVEQVRATEKPVLIDPGIEDPRAYIIFDPSTGEALPVPLQNNQDGQLKTARGYANMAVLGLNRPDLRLARAQHLMFLSAAFVLATSKVGVVQQLMQVGETRFPRLSNLFNLADVQYNQPDAAADALAVLQLAVTPEAEYSAMAQDAILVWCGGLRETLGQQARPVTYLFQAPPPSVEVAMATANIAGLQFGSYIQNYQQKMVEAIAAYEQKLNKEDAYQKAQLRNELHGELNRYIAEYKALQKTYHPFDAQQQTEAALQDFYDLFVVVSILETEYGFADLSTPTSKERIKLLQEACNLNIQRLEASPPEAPVFETIKSIQIRKPKQQ